MKIQLYSNSQTSGYVELVDFLGNELTPVNAARVSFGKESKELTEKDKKLIKYLIKHNHTSPFEHNVITFKFKVPLFVARQHMRHRTWSFNEISRRYTSVDLDFYQPQTLRSPHNTNRQASVSDSSTDPVLCTLEGEYGLYDLHASEAINNHVNNSINLFNQLIENDICREQARMILPQNMYTTYIGTVNLNNLIKFIKLRDHEGAQLEIQEMAIACKTIANHCWPQILEFLE
jgi:thymidylate synthase (FAD)